MSADLSTPEKAWEALVKALQSGDEKAIRAVCTDNGFNSLFPADEIQGIDLGPDAKVEQYKDFGKYIAPKNPKWDDKGSTKIAALEKSDAENMCAIEIEFAKSGNDWKADKYTEKE